MRAFLRGRAEQLRAKAKDTAEGRTGRCVEMLKSQSTVTAVAQLARGNPTSVASTEDFDADLFKLGTPAGTVDLRTGALIGAQRNQLITRQTRCGPADNGELPSRWLHFLDEIMQGDREVVSFLQRAAGYALTGSTQEHKLLFLYGSGRNGKSVFLNMLLDIWGDYGRRVAASTFLATQTERHTTDIASLRGARLAVASELPRGKSWDEAVIKDLTGGDRMTARFMRQNFFEFDPQLTLMIAGNTQPSFKGVDTAIRSRVVLVPFTLSIPQEKQDHTLGAALHSEGPAILRWCIEGALEWQKRGLDVPVQLQQATQEYFDDEDIVGQFLQERTVATPSGFASGDALIQQFNHWMDLQGLARWSKTTLMKELRGRGFESSRRSCARGLRGLVIK